MNPGTITYAAYLESPLAEYRGNPLIEALPPILTEQEAAQAIARYPAEPAEEQALDGSIRLHCIDRLRSVVQPLPIHLELEAAVSLIIRGGYAGRNPMQPSTVRHLHGLSSGTRIEDGAVGEHVLRWALFIDELQHLRTAKTGGKNNMLNFFVNLLNSIGIPVVFIGTNSMIDLFGDVLRNARRACGVGLYNFRQPASNDPA